MNNALRLRIIDFALKRADVGICSLPTPAEPHGAYFEVWGELGEVHGTIGRACDAIRDYLQAKP